MAVDVKTLTIGSHVEYKGKRGRILYVSPGSDFMNCGIHTTDDCGLPANYHVSGFEQIQPIPITSALLKELGFEEDKTDIFKRVGGYFIYFHQVNNLRWGVSLEEENCTNYGDTLCRYLHEAEAFLSLHNIELIKE